MKPNHLKTTDNTSSFICCLFRKLTFLVFLVFAMQQISRTESLPSSFDHPGNETDRIALLAIKNQLIDHHPKGILSSWNSSIHHCIWEGVTCDHKHNRVTNLTLHSSGLSGTISPFIGNLSFLHTLYLYNNSLSGQIPSSLGGLFRLQNLGLNKNALVGGIPANLSGCINLQFLDIKYNHLEGAVPAELRALSKLEYFFMDSNNLTGPLFDIIQNFTFLEKVSAAYNAFTGTIPNSIDRMRNLTSICLRGNKLSGILPMSLFNLSSLQNLDLSNNLLHGQLPSQMGFNASGLKWFDLSENSFSGSIPTMTNFTSLEQIILENNYFTGMVPHGFQQFRNLTSLFLSYNNLQGDINFINTLVNCTQLKFLTLSGNDFSGILPNSIANLSSVVHLTVGDSMISGILPPGITNLINLEELIIGNSKLTASIPHDIGKLYKLETLDLHSNRITGKIPDSLGNLSRLSRLDLSDNKLEESIPGSIQNCQSLLYLNLSYNELNGTLDKGQFKGSATFIGLDLSHNNLEGSLPLEISKQTSLVTLRMSRNKFSGLLPDGLSESTELQSLYMDGNSFHGEIPLSYSSLASLQEIDFSRNNLSGPIPVFLSTIPSIYFLDLSHNFFQGSVPTNSVFANASAIFLDGNTGLCGGIPQLHLPKCTERNNKLMSYAFRLIILVLGGLLGGLAIVTGIYLVRVRKKKAPLSSDPVLAKAFMKVSYDMLLKATGGFSSESLVGSGSSGSVYKGILDGNTVAVKVLNSKHCDASKSFLSECNALRNARHRNLVAIVTACASIDFQGNDFRALVYEFMPNGSLDRWLHGFDGNMSLLQRVGIAIDVAHALIYLHQEIENPIVHRDLKPSNILLDNDMVAHVGDFGLAKFLTQPLHINQSSTAGFRGTIGYAAPEYGLGSEASAAGDVYSYGILLLELMTGKSPTDNMFKDDYNLHMYAEAALPDQVLQIVDPALEEDNLKEDADDRTAIQDECQQRVECICSVITVGVSCSNHLPHDRMKLTDAIIKLQSARDNLLDTK
ncbi:uncharacterized protein LOC141586137 [Silene latifolia]|uniref:uncharacterized protein LOC141586137 n=1 Tax=Silene latifolia TaxID=37657 RepID=UPI003D7807EF